MNASEALPEEREAAVEDQAHQAIAKTLLALLRGEEPVSWEQLFTAPTPAALVERSSSGDRAAQFLLRTRDMLRELPERVGRALSLEVAPVALPDGSSLALDQAERLLANKEARASHRPLRESISATLDRFREFTIHGSEGADQELQLWLRQTIPLRDAAREALATLGGEELHHAWSLARALDLPDEHGAFGENGTLALVSAARDAAAPGHRVSRFRSPRQLSGVCALLDEGGARIARFAQPMLLRFERHHQTVVAACGAFCPISVDDESRTLLGRAMAMGALSCPTRRALGEGRAAAERSGRIAAAVLLLRMRGQAAIGALADVGGARDALVEAYGCDPGREVTIGHLAQSWTRVQSTPAASARACLGSVELSIRLRDAYDENYVLRREAWRETPLRDLPRVRTRREIETRKDQREEQDEREDAERDSQHGGEHGGEQDGEPVRRWTSASIAWFGPLL